MKKIRIGLIIICALTLSVMFGVDRAYLQEETPDDCPDFEERVCLENIPHSSVNPPTKTRQTALTNKAKKLCALFESIASRTSKQSECLPADKCEMKPDDVTVNFTSGTITHDGNQGGSRGTYCYDMTCPCCEVEEDKKEAAALAVTTIGTLGVL